MAPLDAARFRSADGGSSSGLKGVNGSQPQTKAQILAKYRNQLREYRALQVQWVLAVYARHLIGTRICS